MNHGGPFGEEVQKKGGTTYTPLGGRLGGLPTTSL